MLVLRRWSEHGKRSQAALFASLADFTHLTMHLLASDGRWLAMKGVVPEDEIAALPSNVKVLAIEKLVVPGLEEERHLIVLGKE